MNPLLQSERRERDKGKVAQLRVRSFFDVLGGSRDERAEINREKNRAPSGAEWPRISPHDREGSHRAGGFLLVDADRERVWSKPSSLDHGAHAEERTTPMVVAAASLLRAVSELKVPPRERGSVSSHFPWCLCCSTVLSFTAETLLLTQKSPRNV